MHLIHGKLFYRISLYESAFANRVSHRVAIHRGDSIVCVPSLRTTGSGRVSGRPDGARNLATPEILT